MTPLQAKSHMVLAASGPFVAPRSGCNEPAPYHRPEGGMKAKQRQQDVLEGADSAWIAPVIPLPGGIGAFEHVLLSLLCLHAAFWSMVRRGFIASASGCHKWPPLAARTVSLITGASRFG